MNTIVEESHEDGEESQNISSKNFEVKMSKTFKSSDLTKEGSNNKKSKMIDFKFDDFEDIDKSINDLNFDNKDAINIYTNSTIKRSLDFKKYGSEEINKLITEISKSQPVTNSNSILNTQDDLSPITLRTNRFETQKIPDYKESVEHSKNHSYIIDEEKNNLKENENIIIENESNKDFINKTPDLSTNNLQMNTRNKSKEFCITERSIEQYHSAFEDKSELDFFLKKNSGITEKNIIQNLNEKSSNDMSGINKFYLNEPLTLDLDSRFNKKDQTTILKLNVAKNSNVSNEFSELKANNQFLKNQCEILYNTISKSKKNESGVKSNCLSPDILQNKIQIRRNQILEQENEILKLQNINLMKKQKEYDLIMEHQKLNQLLIIELKNFVEQLQMELS